MNRLLITLVTSLLFTAGPAQAQALFDIPNAFGHVTFYAGDPGLGSPKLADVLVNNSPVATTIHGIEQATYVVIEFHGTPYTFALAESGSWNKNTVILAMPKTAGFKVQLGHDGRVSLAELFDALASDQTLLARLSGTAITDQ